MKRMMYELPLDVLNAIDIKAKADRVQKGKIVEDALRIYLNVNKKEKK